MTQYTRFNWPGSRQWRVISYHQGEVMVVADNLRIEAGFLIFTNGKAHSESTIITTINVEGVKGFVEVPLEGEDLRKWMEYEASLMSDFNKAHFNHFINPLTGETLRQLKDRKERPIPPIEEQKRCWNRATSHDCHLWGPNDDYCPGLIA